MQKNIEEITDIEGQQVKRITTLDERWYGFQENNPITGLPEWQYVPSITWIGNYYPKGKEYTMWVAKNGWDEAEEIKREAGDRGTIVHHAIEKLMAEGELRMDALIKDREGVEREMTPDEYYCVITFSQWWEEAGRPKAVHVEKTVRSRMYNFAGTLDYIFLMPDGTNYLLDIKTSKNVWPSHKLQVNALYYACDENNIAVDKIGILQVGYTANKNKHYKLTEVKTDFELFLSVRKIWADKNDGGMPFQRDYPLVLKLNNEPVKEVDNQSKEEVTNDGKIKRNTKTSKHNTEAEAGN